MQGPRFFIIVIMPTSEPMQRYWRTNVRLVAALLTIWFVVAYLGGIVFADQLDTIRLGGVGLGFWIAQQGSLYVFVVLIVVYAILMNRLDRRFGVQEEDQDGDVPPTR